MTRWPAPCDVAHGAACAAGIIKSFLSESTVRSRCPRRNALVLTSPASAMQDGTNRARAFAYMSLAWGISCVVAPAAGGLLSRPAEQYPGLVSADSFFGRWPFALPCLVAVVVQLVSLIICAVWMQDSVRAQPKVSRKVTPQPAPTRNGHMLLVNEAVGGESDSEPETDGRAVQRACSRKALLRRCMRSLCRRCLCCCHRLRRSRSHH